jgi:hypothetical protein
MDPRLKSIVASPPPTAADHEAYDECSVNDADAVLHAAMEATQAEHARNEETTE